MIARKPKYIISIGVALLVLSGCSSSPEVTDSLYRASEEGRSKKVVRCKVLEAREVKIRSEKGDNAGSTFGAIIGYGAGSEIGGGTGSIYSSLLGSMGGAMIGDKVGDKLSERKAVEYSVILTNGEESTHVQSFLKGDRVLGKDEDCRLQVSYDGKNRVLPVRGFSDAVTAPKKTKIIN